MATKFPEDRDIEWYKSQIELSASVSPRKTITLLVWLLFLKYILHKDDSFSCCYVDSQESLQKLGLGKKWNQFADSQKDALWKNVQKMVVLGDKILAD